MKNNVYHYINMTNGIEAIPELDEYRFVRIQSTWCEQKEWDRVLQDLDYDFLMNLALGHLCYIHDYGANKMIPRAIYQGCELIKYVLYRRWLKKDYVPMVGRGREKCNCQGYFSKCYDALDRRTMTKLNYFLPYINTNEINLIYKTSSTFHDGEVSFYKNILLNHEGGF